MFLKQICYMKKMALAIIGSTINEMTPHLVPESVLKFSINITDVEYELPHSTVVYIKM